MFDGEHRLLAQTGNRVDPADLRRDDFGRIVAVAARKLALDLSKLAMTLYREYGVGSVGSRCNEKPL